MLRPKKITGVLRNLSKESMTTACLSRATDLSAVKVVSYAISLSGFFLPNTFKTLYRHYRQHGVKQLLTTAVGMNVLGLLIFCYLKTLRMTIFDEVICEV